ncbi:MAG: ribosomal-processing cysteine protease Prp [Defluviitaleaceae bacterium]|nr:ribosomal-processing cysteine protease Prp [Defluviitaleaceae bacterium]
MILAEVIRKKWGVDSFTVKNHGDSYVCSAVSMLVLNTVNSIEALTDQAFDCDYNNEGGYISFYLTGPMRSGTAILLDSMILGLTSVQDQYPTEIKLTII